MRVQRKVCKRKDASRGRLLSRDSKVKVTRSVELRWTPLSCGVCSAAVIHDGLKLAAYQTVNAE